MPNKKIDQNGFHVLEIVLGVCIVGLIFFVGLKVIGGHKVAVDSKTDAAGVSQPTITAPAGWRVFADKAIGIQFIYPAGAGAFAAPTHNVPGLQESRVSGILSGSYMPGVNGPFTLGTYSTADPEITTRTFGPKVKLEGSDWIVIAPNQNDDKKYQKGDVFSEITRTNAHGIDIYTATSGDEGVVQYKLYFITSNKMRVLELPPFDSGLESSTYNVNDQAPYDTMYQQVRDSISLY